MNITPKNDRNAVILALLLAIVPASPVYAAFEDLGIGARVPGMGNAFVAVADDINSIYYNPSGLSSLERPKVMASHALLFSGLSDGSSLGLSNLAAVLPLREGRLGTFGVLWNQFSLTGVYSERTIQASYGYRFPKTSKFSKFAAGASFKYLTHSFTRLEESANAVEDGILQNGKQDPVLMGSNSKSAMDTDVGLLYDLNKKYTLGLAVMNLMQANVGFSSSDPVPMKTRLGASYKALWLLMTSELQLQKAPDGKTDKVVLLAAEKIFPSLDRGDFGIRASVGVGDRDFSQITAGLSYKISKIQFDYGFGIPLGTIKDTNGSHKLAMVFHFGSPTQGEQYADNMLEQYKKIKENTDYTSSRQIASLNDPRIKDVKAQIDVENYYAANQLLLAKAPDLLPDASVVNLTKRLGLIASYYPSMPKDRREKWENVLSAGMQNYLKGNDAKALKEVAFAQAQNQQDSSLSGLLDKMEETTKLKAGRVPSDFSRGYIEYKIQESDVFYAEKKYDDALSRLNDILSFEADNLVALKKAGSCHYMLGEYELARKSWDAAFKKETDPDEKLKLQKIIGDAGKKAGKEDWAPKIAGAAPAAKTQADAAPAGAAAQPAGKPGTRDAREIEKLYQQGADYYTKGDYGRAADVFRKILVLDPENSQAKKALERIIRLTR